MRALRAFTAQIMGMPISVHVRAEDADRDDIAHAAGQVFAHLRKVDSVFSLYRPDSELMRWRVGEIATEQLHPWVEEVGLLCDEAHEKTGGLFTAWLPATGPVLDASTRAFDPTGLVKGWAVRGAAAYLQEVPGIAYCLNAAGDITVGTGRQVDAAAPWRVGIEDPGRRGRIARTVELTTGAVATSGSAVRGEHFYDPRSARWTATGGSATVVGPDVMWADVWATAAAVDAAAADQMLHEQDAGYSLTVLPSARGDSDGAAGGWPAG